MCHIFNEHRHTMEPLPCYSEPKERQHRSRDDISTSPAPSAFTHGKPLETGGLSCLQPTCDGRRSPTAAAARSPPPVPKQKLWSLAEIATSPSVGSNNAHQACAPGEDGDCAVISTSVRSPCKSSPRCHLLNNVTFPRHLCYTSSVYTNFASSASHLNGRLGTSPAAAPHTSGLNQFVFQRGTQEGHCDVVKVWHAKSKTFI